MNFDTMSEREGSPESPHSRMSRRRLLKTVAGGGLAASIIGSSPGPTTQTTNPIVEENRKPGTTDWQLTYVKTEHRRSGPSLGNEVGHRSKLIEGYCSETSVRPGDTLDIFLSADPATPVTIDIYRMGYYQGKGGRHITQLGPFEVEPQPDPPIQEHRLRECEWERTTQVEIPDDWLSGVYLGKLSCEKHRYQSYVIFIIRDDREADLLFQCSDTTWQAYNKWPNNFSVYDSNPPFKASNARTWVSFDRPYGQYPQVVDQPLSQGSGEFICWEFPLCFWLEKHGYNVTYWSNIDTHFDRLGLNRVDCFISVGHDEYWSLDMYYNVKNAVNNGLNAAFLSGNSICWVIPLNMRNSEGRQARIMYRRGRFGGIDPRREDLMEEPWENHGPREELLMGASTTVPANGSADWIITNADHWIFEGTNVENGDRIPGLVGWEGHGGPADLPGLEVIASGTQINSGDEKATYHATVYPGPQDNWVFNAATIFWSMDLSNPPGVVPPHSHFGRPHGPDERVQKITSNFFARCGVQPA
jgi:hypothetical protein